MRSLVNLLVVALAYVQSNITDAGEYRASSYVFGTLARITVVDDDPARAQRAAASMFREFDRMHRDLHAWQPGELVALNEAIARGETYRRSNSMELWSGHRKVRRWEGVHDCETLYENQPSLPNARRSPRDLDERWDARGENPHVGVFPDSETSRTV